MSSTADIFLREDGIVVARIHPGVRQSVHNARANLAGAIAVRGGEKRPILVDISHCEPLDADVRRVYTGETLVASFSAIAMLVEASAFGRMIGNIYLQIAGLGIPARLFSDETQALAWLQAFTATVRRALVLEDDGHLHVYRSPEAVAVAVEALDAETVLRAVFDERGQRYRIEWTRPNRGGVLGVSNGVYRLVADGPPDPAALLALIRDKPAADDAVLDIAARLARR
ncbi:MAG TPA: hypothetical protein VFF06_08480 [Polyangia bacterium]|nr:hypothetical protein [Polyangia bacterium]